MEGKLEDEEQKEMESEKFHEDDIYKEEFGKKNKGEESEYNVGDLVLAKISGYPWWPGMIFPEDLVSKEVKEAKPISKKRGNGAGVQYWLVRFFPAPEYIWASKNDIRPLTSKMIDDFLSKKTTKKDIRESYEIAKTCPTVKDLLDQQTFKAEDNTEKANEDEDGEEVEEDEEEFVDDDDMKNEENNEDLKKKNVLKRKINSKKDENKKRKLGNNQNKEKLNNQGKTLSGKSQKILNKIQNGESNSDEHSNLFSEQSSQVKWEQKKQQVLFLRHKLQRIMLTTGKIPSEADMPIVSEQLEKLETFKGIDAAILRTTKIGKVLKRIVQLSDIPNNEEYSIKERSEKLLDFWKDLLENPSNNNIIKDNQEKKGNSFLKKDISELHTINGDD
ncbi:hypothetical protein PCANB_001172 [Pneumocystis canis]|nr:hypothetical protein PCANB_001172 [Pneumocystis canis]